MITDLEVLYPMLAQELLICRPGLGDDRAA